MDVSRERLDGMRTFSQAQKVADLTARERKLDALRRGVEARRAEVSGDTVEKIGEMERALKAKDREMEELTAALAEAKTNHTLVAAELEDVKSRGVTVTTAHLARSASPVDSVVPEAPPSPKGGWFSSKKSKGNPMK